MMMKRTNKLATYKIVSLDQRSVMKMVVKSSKKLFHQTHRRALLEFAAIVYDLHDVTLVFSSKRAAKVAKKLKSPSVERR